MQVAPHSRNLRKGRYSRKGQIYLITTRCDSGRVFGNPVLGQIVADEIVASDQAGYSKTLAHVVMPNHIHWLLVLTGDESLSRVVGRMKGRASRRIGRSGLSSGKVWQPGFYDHALRRNEDLYSAAHYVLNNPVRAGLVEHYSEYPLSYSVWQKQ